MRLKAILFACLLAAAPAAAQTRNETVPPEQLAREAIELMLQALQGAIANLPQYAAPEIDQDGNITIRRLNPKRLARPEPTPAPDGAMKL
jgi:hypothetical protein